MVSASVLRNISPNEIRMKYAMEYLSKILEKAVINNVCSVNIVLFEWPFSDILEDIIKELGKLGYEAVIKNGVLEIRWEK